MDKKMYNNIHNWLRKKYGNANHCENPECQGWSKTFEWALIKGKKYDFNRDNFMQLCKSCHVYYDYTDEQKAKMSKKRIGLKRSLETRRKISESKKGVKRSKEHQEKLTNISRDRAKKIVKCPICGVEGSEIAMKRWHFNNCRPGRKNKGPKGIFSDQARKNISESKKGTKLAEETKRKISISLKKYYDAPVQSEEQR